MCLGTIFFPFWNWLQVILLGAGLVGVELAAELIHFFPTLKIALADRCETVLPTLPKDAQDYAQKWLIDHGIDLRLGQEGLNSFLPTAATSHVFRTYFVVQKKMKQISLFKANEILW